jgi:hypothetical protein
MMRGTLLFYAGTAALMALFALAAAVLVDPAYALPIVVLAVVVLGFFALNDVVARRNLARHGGDSVAAQDDASESVPSAHLIPDETALGDTAEAHDELSPHDVPIYAPNRRAVELQAARTGGTTRGNEYGAAGGRRLREKQAPPTRT